MAELGKSIFPIEPEIPPLGNAANFPMDEKIVHIEDLPDGSSVYQIGEEEQEELEVPTPDFDMNLAEQMDEGTLNRIAGELLDGIDQDIKSREEWEESYTKGMKLLGFKVEEFRDYPFARSCAAVDSTLSTALLRFTATARAEMFPAKGPASSLIVGERNEQLEKMAVEQQNFMNHYLTQIDKEYYPDSERLLNYVGIVGSSFRKVYADPLTGRPKARFIHPQDFIADNNATSIFNSPRLTQRLYLNRKELILRQLNGYYRMIDLPDNADDADQEVSKTTATVRKIEGINLDANENKSLFTLYEVHADLDLNGFEHVDKDGNQTGMPLPYIVSIFLPTRKILSIRRNWDQGDEFYTRREYFVQYNYLPGFGLYGLGLAQLLGSNSLVLTSVLRQLIDAGTLKNFPGGLKMKGLRIEQNDKAIGPSEFWDIETGGLPIQQAVMLMPYNEPSLVLKELRNELMAQCQQLASTTETKISESSQETPVGTTLAILEVANKVQSSVLRSLHLSLSHELELIFKLFAEGMEDDPYQFHVPGGTHTITKDHFNDNIKIIPVSDPNLTTSTQRILRAEGILRLAQSAPQLHDLRYAYLMMYEAMNVDAIDKLLPLPPEVPPLDPVTENMNAMKNMPLKAALWQDHNAHIAVHGPLAQENPAIAAHIQEHRAFQYLLDMQQKMGLQIPPVDQIMNPEVQNQIAMMAAKAAMEMMQQIQENQPKPLDPNQVMLQDMQVRRETAHLKKEEAELRAETEAFKAQLKFESEKARMEAQQEMAEEKNEVDLTLAEMKALEARNRKPKGE